MNETSDSMNLKKVCLNVLSVSAVLFLLWAAVFGTLEPMYQMGIGMLLVFVYSFLKKPVQLPGSFKWVARIIDTIFIAIGSICIVYVIIFAEDLSWRLGNPTTIDLTVGTLGTIIILEFCRRTKNIPLAILGIFFALYALMGSYIPGEFGNSGFSVQRIVRFVWLSSEGVWGSITMLVAKVLLMFVFWGSLLQVTGAADFFMRLAFVLTRKVKSGPCLSAVVASSLVGTVVGSSTGNVVTTGPITIPLMKKFGFSPELAGAVESGSSTGGQIMPPVMGIGAFAMAEMSGIPYLQICVAAIIPAILYYVSIGTYVHFHALNVVDKQGKDFTQVENIESFADALKDRKFKLGFINFIPVVFLVFMLAQGWSLIAAGAVAIITTFLIGLILNRRLLLGSFVITCNRTIDVSRVLFSGAAGIGIVVGMISMTGLTIKLSNLVLSLGGGHLLLTLILVAITCIVLGMGMPTVAAYILVAIIIVPAIIDLGLDPLTAHFFAFYFSVLSAITPPVCAASLAAATIAGGSFLKTAFLATQVTVVAFFVPFLFAYDPAYLWNGSFPLIAYTLIKGIIATTCLSLAITGYINRRIGIKNRAMFLITAILFFVPVYRITDFAGFILLTAVVIFMLLKKPRLNLQQKI